MSAGRLMTKLRYPPVAHEQIMAGLEAGAAALRALEVAAARSDEADGTDPDALEHLNRSIELLRESIRELRLAETDKPRPGATGFVLAVRRRREGGKPPTDPPQA